MPRLKFAAAARCPMKSRMRGRRANVRGGRSGVSTYEINVQQYACAGLNFGTYYDRSPIIAYDGAEHPAYTMDSYTPSTVPGCRTPHLWREDGRSLYDAMGPEFTLLRFDAGVDVAALEAAARSRRLPLKVLDVEAACSTCLQWRGWYCRGRTSTWPGAATACRPIRWR